MFLADRRDIPLLKIVREAAEKGISGKDFEILIEITMRHKLGFDKGLAAYIKASGKIDYYTCRGLIVGCGASSADLFCPSITKK